MGDVIPKALTALNSSAHVTCTRLAFYSTKNGFSVAIIPYTWENTTFKTLQVGDSVNLEFDVIGKYVARLTNL
mgnify:CR=1 FL=1